VVDTRRTQTYRALFSCLVRHLQAHREATLDRIKAKGWRWDPALSRELDAADDALVRIGAFDTK